MASAELNSRPQPLFWTHVASWFRSIPRAALLSMVGPSLLCVLGYFGWRYYGAPNLDLAYYGLKQENIHLSEQPEWLRKTNVLEEVFRGGALANLSLLDGQTPANLARVFDAHPCVRKTHRVEKMAGGQVMIHLEYRMPVALVCLPVVEEATGTTKDGYFAVDQDSVLLDTKNFTDEDVRKYILIYLGPDKVNTQRMNGKPFGDVRVEEAVKLCAKVMAYRDATKINRVYVYKAPKPGKSNWWLELETANGNRIEWGSAPGLEGLGEPTVDQKLTRLFEIARDKKLWAEKNQSLVDVGVPTTQK